MPRQRTKSPSLQSQVRKRNAQSVEEAAQYTPYEGNTELMISTGSTLLDLAIAGTRVKYGGLPGGILVEISGNPGSGKTVLLSEIAGAIKRQTPQGDVLFSDPEGRLNARFAAIFGLTLDAGEYSMPDTVSGVFAPVRAWNPRHKNVINGIFADSLAALSTEMEMETEDKRGQRRAKEFSTEGRKTCRILRRNNFLMVCSNQLRQNMDANPFSEQDITPGGKAIPYYASLRLRCLPPKKIWQEKTINGKKYKRVVGVEINVYVYKSSIDKPYRTAPVIIHYDYGIDDVRANLEFVKHAQGLSNYTADGRTSLGTSLDTAVKKVERLELESILREQTVLQWNRIESAFTSERKPKVRF